jgi:hypothetical protein
LRQHQWLAALAVLAASLASSATARAQTDEDESNPPPAETPAPPHAPKTAPAATATSTGGGTATAPATFFEEMGPDTFPGRLRGLYGGSLWLEPTFAGLQWPRNTRTGIGFSGMFALDSGYEIIKRDQPTLLDSTNNLQQGRALLRVTPAYVRDRFFIQGQAELVASGCQAPAPNAQTTSVCSVSGTVTADDLWIRVGHWDAWDLKVGRFEGWEVYHLGMGLDRYTLQRLGAGMFGQTGMTGVGPQFDAPFLYGVDYVRNRPAEGLAVGLAALHLYPTDFLRFELLGKWGSDNYQDNNATAAKPYNYVGGRPVAIVDVGWLKLKVGADYQKGTAVLQTIGGDPGAPQMKKDPVETLTREGVGASLQFVIDPIVEFGLNGAIGRQHYVDASANAFASADTMARSYTTKSAGAFANVRVADGWLAGLGANLTEQSDEYKAPTSSANDYASHLQGFVALQCLLERQLYIKAQFAYAKALFQPSDFVPSWNNYMYSGGVRLMYLY